MTCFAYNTNGQRCELAPGHDGDHQISVRWTDEECWEPLSHRETPQGTFTAPNPVAFGETGYAVITEDGVEPVRSDPAQCEVCEHSWHEDRCGADDDGFFCDCARGI